MLMKWEDLLPGDKLRIKEEVCGYYDKSYYNFNEIWGDQDLKIIESVLKDGFIQLKLVNKNGSIGNFIINPIGHDPYSNCPNIVFFEIVSLSEDN